MIYLLDSSLDEHSHSRYVIDIIKEHSDVEVKLIPLSTDMTIGELSETVNNLIPIVIPTDIVLCPWAIPGNSDLDNLFDNRYNLTYNTKHELRLGGEIGRHNRLKICRR